MKHFLFTADNVHVYLMIDDKRSAEIYATIAMNKLLDTAKHRLPIIMQTQLHHGDPDIEFIRKIIFEMEEGYDCPSDFFEVGEKNGFCFVLFELPKDSPVNEKLLALH